MTTTTVEMCVHFRRQARGRQELHEGDQPNGSVEGLARIPRVARLMALALRLERLLLDGLVRDHAELARLGHVTRARISQVLTLVHLAPDIQEEVLFLRGGYRGTELLLADLRTIAVLTDWVDQRRRWRKLLRARGS